MRALRVAGGLGAAVVLAFGFIQAEADAKTLRWSSQGDFLTMDPHAQNEALNNAATGQVYEPLINRDKEMKLEPSLATSWKQEGTDRWRFTLRQGVKFHDGAPFTADDVVFSIQRVMAPTSNFKQYLVGVTEAKKVDDFTVDIITSGPNPVLLQQLTEVRIMSKAWSEKHNVVKPQNFVEKEETYAVRNMNGTGPYMLKSREVDIRTVFVENPNWWGKREGNVTEMVYQPIKSDATRISALISGEIDFVLDPPLQDIERLKRGGAKVVEGNENRTIFFGFDQHRDELLYSNVKGKNPFKDLKVRQAVYHAIDIEAIKSRIMRGQALPTGSIIAPQVNGFTKEIDVRLPLDRAKAKQLLAEAGYPNGFEVTLDCPNNRYINDEEICQAVTAMLAQVGIQAKLNAMPRATYFPKIQKYETSFYMLGWGVPTFDALYSLQSLAQTVGQGGDGNFNLGKYSNPKFDALVNQIKIETDQEKRNAMIVDALKIHNADVAHVPLHHQVIPWAMRANVNVVHRADNRLELRWVQIN
ncbi:MAG TPA: ABC transporter substrate-binding protein [Alphaproteobacteria bacterium]|nr:ABC transporter substrate-binding protein [Alphaproteobacteria bacterium]